MSSIKDKRGNTLRDQNAITNVTYAYFSNVFSYQDGNANTFKSLDGFIDKVTLLSLPAHTLDKVETFISKSELADAVRKLKMIIARLEWIRL